MSFINGNTLQNIFPNKELSNFYITVAIGAFGDRLMSIFVPIYLYQMGYPIYQILFFYFISFLFFIIFAHAAMRLILKIGPKHSILYSAPLIIVYYLGLLAIPDFPFLFYVLPICLAGRMLFYNYGYHLHIIPHLDSKHEGGELSFINALILISSLLAPVLGGILAQYHFSILYVVGSVILLLSNIPLFLTKDTATHHCERIKLGNTINQITSKKWRGAALSFAGYGAEVVIGATIWPIYLIVVLGNIEKTGFIVSLSLVFSLVVFYAMGKITDTYNKRKILHIGSLLYFLGWVGRIFATNTLLILAVDSYKNMSEKILHIPWIAKCYDLAKQKDYPAFLVFQHFVYNSTRTLIIPVLIVIFYLDFYPFILSFIIAAIGSLGYSQINRTANQIKKANRH
ncbi:hypothetical protein KKG46_01275 [Patescibacteria group bacterium]|nr:hypothetical protein [Patescibacteria group bacterium]